MKVNGQNFYHVLLRKIKRSDKSLPEDEIKKVEMLQLSRHSFEKVQECEVTIVVMNNLIF